MATRGTHTRIARIGAIDIAEGDVIVSADGEFVGRVEGDPHWDSTAARVSFDMYDGVSATVVQSYPDTKVVRIEIERRTS